jgi:TolB-like protein
MTRSIIIGALIISAAVLLNGFLERHARMAPTTETIAPASAALADRPIAVMPFSASDSDGSSNAFAAGLQREIITRLTAQHLKAASVQDIPSTGQALIGSVQRAGNRVRVHVQLVDAASRVPRWAETYDREISDVLALESEIAGFVAKSVATKEI